MQCISHSTEDTYFSHCPVPSRFASLQMSHSATGDLQDVSRYIALVDVGNTSKVLTLWNLSSFLKYK